MDNQNLTRLVRTHLDDVSAGEHECLHHVARHHVAGLNNENGVIMNKSSLISVIPSLEPPSTILIEERICSED